VHRALCDCEASIRWVPQGDYLVNQRREEWKSQEAPNAANRKAMIRAHFCNKHKCHSLENKDANNLGIIFGGMPLCYILQCGNGTNILTTISNIQKHSHPCSVLVKTTTLISLYAWRMQQMQGKCSWNLVLLIFYKRLSQHMYIHTYIHLMSVSLILTGKGKVHPRKRHKGSDGE